MRPLTILNGYLKSKNEKVKQQDLTVERAHPKRTVTVTVSALSVTVMA